jgi:hypothetical protein
MSVQIETGPSTSERGTIFRFFRRLCSAQGMWRVLIVLAWTVTIIGLWYGEENWRGRRAWNQYREATEARGESLDFATYVPKPVPDDENFAATSLLKSFILQRNVNIVSNDLYLRAGDHVTENTLKDRGRRHYLDLVAWQMAGAALQNGELKPEQKFETDQTDLAARAAAAPAVLEGMKTDQAEFAEALAASTRKFSRYPLNYDVENPWGILLPHLFRIKYACQRLSLEACAELAADQTGPALADEKLMLALADSIKSEPFIISLLVRAACVEIGVQPVWEGLAEHRWTEAQLQELQARFLAYDFLADLQVPLKAERAMGVQIVDLLNSKRSPIKPSPFVNSQDQMLFEQAALDVLGNVMPSGWFYQEKLNYCALFDAQCKGAMDVGAKTISPSKVAAKINELTRQIYGGPSVSPLKAFLRHRIIAAMVLLQGYNNIPNIPAKIAMAQTATDQAALACALERYRLAHGQFPDQLEALTPQYMPRQPNDVITGQPYKYRRTEDGQFILYSVGWNEKDDGGAAGKTLFDQTQGDWVWSYPSK